MKGTEVDQKNFDTKEKFSRRTQCGVEIVEWETITKIKVSGDRYVTAPPVRPRLVVTDAINATRNFIAKRRSELSELDKFLQSVSPRPLKSE